LGRVESFDVLFLPTRWLPDIIAGRTRAVLLPVLQRYREVLNTAP
jgi:hypothetical protein